MANSDERLEGVYGCRMLRGPILLVDEELGLRDLLIALLETGGYRVVAARNAAHAFELLTDAAEMPAVAVVDITIAKVNGCDLIDKLRASTRFAALPIIALHDDAQGSSAAPAASASIRKPVATSALLQTIARFT